MNLDMYLKQLEELVNIDSGSRNPAGIAQVADKRAGMWSGSRWERRPDRCS